MIKVLIADDHVIVREGLKTILSETPDILVAGEAGTGEEALEKACKDDFHIVLLDLSMPGRGGLDTLKTMRIEMPKLPVLVLSIYPEEQYAKRVLKSGASGYLTKESAPDALISAIRKVMKGGKYVSPSLAEDLALDLSRDKAELPHETLSNREFQVMLMIASGITVREIGKTISLSPKTISTYRSRILEKMRMKNNAEITYYAIKQELV